MTRAYQPISFPLIFGRLFFTLISVRGGWHLEGPPLDSHDHIQGSSLSSPPSTWATSCWCLGPWVPPPGSNREVHHVLWTQGTGMCFWPRKFMRFIPNTCSSWQFSTHLTKYLLQLANLPPKKLGVKISGDSWMYPYPSTPMGNPYMSPI